MIRIERALGEKNVVTLETLCDFSNLLREYGEFEEAHEVWEKCLAGRMKIFGEDHPDTLGTLSCLGTVYAQGLQNYKRALEYFERDLQGSETMLGGARPYTLSNVTRRISRLFTRT